MIRPLLILSVAALAAACGQAEPPAQPEAPAAPEAPAPVDANALRPEGWGPLRIGMTRTEVEAALGPDANPDAVGGPDPQSCDEFRPERAPAGMLVMIENGVLTRISVTEPDLETADGFGVGATATEVKAALGDRARAEPHKYVEAPAEYVFAWAEPRTEPYVQDPNARGVVYEVGAEGTVTAVRVGGPSIQYVEGCA
ncbi:hypothetical protein [Brevundimonas balnearis]|uniref:Lipoprotein n=1 Tax=Brevundimonas balnearis TaxID=1572858 RepID=A0ABV6QZ75_9CAUL